MKINNSFKERVRQVAIKQSKIYKNIFIDYQYLICSYDFKKQDFYILSAEQTNYLHLVGVNTFLTPKEFFTKCFNGTLEESDFDFSKKNTNPSVVKGSVRRKIQSLELLNNFFNKKLLIEENFKKNNITCAIATSDNKITIGFTNGEYSRPKTLLKGNELKTNPINIHLILSKKRNEKLFNTIIYGDKNTLKSFKNKIYHLLSNSLL